MCSSLVIQLMFGFEMWFPQMVEYELQMGWQSERRPVHHQLGLRYLGKTSLQGAVEKSFSSPWFWFLKYFAFFFSISSCMRAPCLSHTAQFTLAKPWKVRKVFLFHRRKVEADGVWNFLGGGGGELKKIRISCLGSAMKQSSLYPGSQSVNGLVNWWWQ